MSEQSIGNLVKPIVKRLEAQMDDYAGWRAMLAGERINIHDGEPLCGFYRGTRRKEDKQLVGIAIFKDAEGAIIAVRDKAVVPVEWVWPFATKYPVTEETYRAWEETGTWSDDHPMPAVPSAPAGLGHNNPPVDAVEVIREQIESARAGIVDYAEIGDDETSARAQSLRSRLLELSREADKIREKEKRPHFEASKAVDALWQPLVKSAKEAADVVAKAMGAWETKKARAAAEAQRKAEEERRRREEEARKAEAAGKPAPAPVLELEPEPTPPPATQVRGAYGRAASVRVVKVARVVDQDKAYGFLRTHKELSEKIGQLAQRAVDAGHTVPGVEVSEERRVA